MKIVSAISWAASVQPHSPVPNVFSNNTSSSGRPWSFIFSSHCRKQALRGKEDRILGDPGADHGAGEKLGWTENDSGGRGGEEKRKRGKKLIPSRFSPPPLPPPLFPLVPVSRSPTICPWVSQDGKTVTFKYIRHLADLRKRSAVGPGEHHVHDVWAELLHVLVHV